jgi:hypothetical protein
LLNNRAKLLDAGIYYPDIGQEFLYGHHNLVNSIRQKDDALITRILAALPAKASHILLSSENFDGISVEAVQYMVTRFEDFDIRIVYFKRDPESLLFSNWQESIKQGGVTTWSEYFLRHLTHPYRSEIINPSLVLDRYKGVLGGESIRVIDYEDVLSQGGDIAVALLREVGANVHIVPLKESLNRSMHSSVIEILRALNQIFANEKKLNKANVREAFFRVTNQGAVKPRVKELLGVVCEYNVHYTLRSSAILAQLENEFVKKYGSGGISKNDVGENASGAAFPSAAWLSDRRGAELLAWLGRQVDKELRSV